MAETRIIFLVLPRSNLLDLSGAAQVFFEARESGVDLEIEYCSFAQSIITSANLPLGKIKNFSQLKPGPGDYLFIVSTDFKYIGNKNLCFENKLLEWIRNAYHSGANICCLCNGVFLLAQTGLLDGRNCTTHWKRTKTLKEWFPKVNVVENILFVEDNRIFTNAGASASIDIALHILGKLRNENFAYNISRELVIYNRRSGHHEQQSLHMSYRNHMHAGIHRLQDWLPDHLDRKITLPDLSDIAYMSTRNLTRIFKKETGVTIKDYITLLRKEQIQQLKKNPDMTRKQIAMLCGLKSEKQVTRIMNGVQNK